MSALQKYILPRKLVRVRATSSTGSQVREFLNKFFTQRLPEDRSVQGNHGLFLDSKGRIISDAIIITGETFDNADSAYIDCPKEGYQIIVNHLKMYSEYSEYELEYETQNSSVLCCTSSDECNHAPGNFSKNYEKNLQNLGLGSFKIRDPRPPMNQLQRVYCDFTFEDCPSVGEENIPKYMSHEELTEFRYSHGVPEGLKELKSCKSFPTQYSFDFLRSIDFEKGCFLGQELTSRTHFVGVTRKRIVPFLAENHSDLLDCYQKYANDHIDDIKVFESQTQRHIGDLVALSGKYGLVMHRYIDELSHNIRENQAAYCKLHDQNLKFKCYRPIWWPERRH